MSTSTTLEQYLTLIDGIKRKQGLPASLLSIEGYVLKHGRVYPSQDMTQAEQEAVIGSVAQYGGPRRLPIKQCFYNSQMLLLATMEPFVYVEGFVWREGLPMAFQHGWLTLNGKVVDLTMRNSLTGKALRPSRRKGEFLGDRVAPMGHFHEPMEYMGAEFTREQVRERVLETKEGGSLLDDWKRNFPFLKA